MPLDDSHSEKLVLTQFGDKFRDCIEIVSSPPRNPEHDEVLIRNIFAGVNGVYDTAMAHDAVGYLDITLPADLGIETVGIVEEVGASVTNLKPGDAVVSWLVGRGYRHFHTTKLQSVFKVPEASKEMVALFPTGLSGLVGLEQEGQIKPNESVVITAAAGGLGHIAVQIAKSAGCQVVGVAGSDLKCDLVKNLGCDQTVNYKKECLSDVLKAEYPNGIDVGFDTVGGELFDTLLDNLAVRGRLVVGGYASEMGIADPDTPRPRVARKLYFKSASVRGFVYPHYKEIEAESVKRLLEAYSGGDLKVLIDPVEFEGLQSVPDAVDHLVSGNNIGKVVVKI